jgi:DnaJ like chaperone protein
MSLWTYLAGLAHRAFDPDTYPTSAADPCAPEAGDAGFTTAVIGLAAKMARADGAASAAELQAAAQVFRPPPGEEGNFRRVFALAQQTVLGFDSYARQIGRKYRDRPCLLEDVLDGLFHIAAADGRVGERELTYLRRVSDLFGFDDLQFRRRKALNLGHDPADPYAALGLLPGTPCEEVRASWRRLTASAHPDQLIGRGAPEAAIRSAERHVAALNAAFEAIRQQTQRVSLVEN